MKIFYTEIFYILYIWENISLCETQRKRNPLIDFTATFKLIYIVILKLNCRIKVCSVSDEAMLRILIKLEV